MVLAIEGWRRPWARRLCGCGCGGGTLGPLCIFLGNFGGDGLRWPAVGRQGGSLYGRGEAAGAFEGLNGARA
ncbi:hypothetical protein LEMA_uP076920.1 [Plenodomus lingam JN3]|uniref:Uncharacterized protein n=1 Tax=Leptosphaeria maculans (strain JN3 / isolate v23.1.3 / race Av1-4-5-6-7-8) TaxID=985895 RepID=E5A908_LEPMJ|nr:hypothetical protein LEMA_uP076920.1 [Plenodomus lingam JN3]CBY00103.1 hypothetical protein LEMA_uP076920.1 [Plenodomus lingam JN3]